MNVELHLLQNFAPSNLNRDDTGSPKDCEFGGYRRARISSQCQKRAIRSAFGASEMIPAENLGYRTARLMDEVTERLVGDGRDREDAEKVVTAALQAVGLKLKEGKTEYLLFLGRDEVNRIADACRRHWETLLATDRGGSKKDAKAAAEKDVKEAVTRALDGRVAADVALFGRMIADLPGNNRDAACQVAHAISTNAVSMEFDFFTAVDDLKPASEDLGAGMLGTVEFNSSCFYRYFSLDLDQLAANLDGDQALAAASLRAFLEAAVKAVPTGKQNTFAAHNPPSLVMAVVRPHGQWSLANAFVKPVAPNRELDMVGASVAALGSYWSRLAGMYGGDGMTALACVDPAYESCLEGTGVLRMGRVDDLVARSVGLAANGTPS